MPTFAQDYQEYQARTAGKKQGIEPANPMTSFAQDMAFFEASEPTSTDLGITSVDAQIKAEQARRNFETTQSNINLEDISGVEGRLKAGETLTAQELKAGREQNAKIWKILKTIGQQTSPVGFEQVVPEGASGGQCGVFAQQITKLPSGADWQIGDSIYDKKQALKQYAETGAAFYPGEDVPQPGNSIIFDEGTKWGHVAVINEVLPDGRLRLTESNLNFDGTVTHSRVISPDNPKIVGFLRTKPSI